MSGGVDAVGWRLERGGLFVRRPFTIAEPAPDDVVIEVAGCGLCHTDVGIAREHIATRHPLPLILGHEISGRVIRAGDGAAQWLGKSVVVPSVIPCGVCDTCLAGRPTICRQQFVPGNDGDGGFASHVRAPARGLCAIPERLPEGVTLAMLCVLAEAIGAPFEAIERADVTAGDVAVFIGTGGAGGFGVQIAAARGAIVIAVDLDDARLELARQHGASLTLNSKSMTPRELRTEVRSVARRELKIFETSGTIAGQQTAFGLLDYGAHLAIIGFTHEKIELRLSQLMAYDATARGNHGCAPEHYPAALQLVLDRRIAIGPYVELHPLEALPELIEASVQHRIRLRPVVVPRSC